MFPLNTRTFPASAAELAERLNESLRRVFALAHDPVQVRDKSYPQLGSVIVSLDGARLPEQPPPKPSVAGTGKSALTIDSFRVLASPFFVGPASVDFQLTANRVDLREAKDRESNVLLLLHNAAEGRVEISVALVDLEALIAEVAKAEAGKHGVNVDSVQLLVRSRSPRSLAAEVGLRAKKLFVRASLRITAQLELDE